MEWINEGGPEGDWSLPVSATHKLFVWWDGCGDGSPFGYAVDSDGMADMDYPLGYAPDLATAQRCAFDLWEAGPIQRQPVRPDDDLGVSIPS